MHIEFCASNYKRAAGHWLALISRQFVLSAKTLMTTLPVFRLQKSESGPSQGCWLSQKPCFPALWSVNSVTAKPKSLNAVLVQCLCWQITSLWHKAGNWWVEHERNIRLLDPFFFFLSFFGDTGKSKQVTWCIKAPVSSGIHRKHLLTLFFLGAPRSWFFQFYNPSWFVSPLSTSPSLPRGQTWVCMRFWRGRVRSEFCEEDWE